MTRPDPFGLNEFFTTLFGDEPGEIEAASHPPHDVLQAYRADRAGSGRLDPEAWLARVKGESEETPWSRQALTAHLMTCHACRERYRQLASAPEPTTTSLVRRVRETTAAVREAFRPMPRPATVAIAAQSLVIVGLAAALLAGPLGLNPADNASPGVAKTSSTAPSPPQGETGTSAGDAPPEPTPSERGQVAATESHDQGSVDHYMRVLSNSDDPEARLAAARKLQDRPDPSLVPELTRLYRKESHREVKQELNRAIEAVMSNMATQYDSAIQAIREFEGTAGRQASELMDEVERRLGQFFSEAGPSSSTQGTSAYDGSLICTASTGLSLAQMRRLSSELGGIMVVDDSLPSDSFRMRLPLSAGLNETLRGLEDEMDLRCYQE
ncbi:MAG: hypothetical protein ABEK03_10615 [Candidatus Bipolaricaulia bacterium]